MTKILYTILVEQPLVDKVCIFAAQRGIRLTWEHKPQDAFQNVFGSKRSIDLVDAFIQGCKTK